MNKKLIYKALYAWWEREKRVLPWRETEDAYRIWLSEIILQQTRVAQGMEYYERFVSRWPRVEDLAAADEQEVMRLWQGLGYYSRARNLHAAAKMIVAEGWAPFPRKWEQIRALPGVGDYTAGAIASFAYNAPYPAMDGNVYRVVARLMDESEAFDTSRGKKLFHNHIDTLLDREHARLFNSAIMEFGALYCTPQLREETCRECVLRDQCLGYQHGTAELLPVRKARPKLRDRYLNYTIYLSRREDGVYTLIHRREEKDIWLHLWEFCIEEHTDGLHTHPCARSIEIKHVLSHQRLHVRYEVQEVETLPRIEGYKAVRVDELDEYGMARVTEMAAERLIYP